MENESFYLAAAHNSAQLDEIDKSRLGAAIASGEQPIDHMSDCSTNNHGCPDLLGPCDCK